jgi:hypothetical protein
MSKTVTAKPPVTVEMAVEVLRKLSPRDRLKVITIVLPEMENELPKENIAQEHPKRESLRGLWKHLNFDITEEDIAEVRKEVWKNFPREDIV